LRPRFVRGVQEEFRRAVEPQALARAKLSLRQMPVQRHFSREPGALPRHVEQRNGSKGRSAGAKPVGIRAPTAAKRSDDAHAGDDDALRLPWAPVWWKQHVRKEPVNRPIVNFGEAVWT
jgi:hypothetical protein